MNFANFSAPAGTSVDVIVSYLVGSATAANTVDPTQWTLHETVTVTSAGQGSPTYVGFSSPIVMPAGTMHALRIEETVGDIYAYQVRVHLHRSMLLIPRQISIGAGSTIRVRRLISSLVYHTVRYIMMPVVNVPIH